VDRSSHRRRRRAVLAGRIAVGHPKGGVRLPQSMGELVELGLDRVGLVPRGHGHKGVANELVLPQQRRGRPILVRRLFVALSVLLPLPLQLKQQRLLVQCVVAVALLKVDRPKVRDALLQVAGRAAPAPVAVPDHQRHRRR
jgi:hypothetical protein